MKLTVIVLLFSLLISLGDNALSKHGSRSYPMPGMAVLTPPQLKIQNFQKHSEASGHHHGYMRQQQHRQQANPNKPNINPQPDVT